MSQSISLFSGYSQRENRTTNYCLLVLKLLYEENPKFLGEVLGALAGETISDYVGVSFNQQLRTTSKSSIPDGVIQQQPFTIYIETKNFDWFYEDQLTRHMESLRKEPGAKILLALSNFESLSIERFDRTREIAEEQKDDKIFFNAVSFDDFVNAIQAPLVPKNLSDVIIDFTAYLEGERLLSSWRQRLDVVNCAGIPDDVLRYGVYMCPAKGGAYNHKRCQYFGMYRNKQVEQVAIIRALVEVTDPEHASSNGRMSMMQMLLWYQRQSIFILKLVLIHFRPEYLYSENFTRQHLGKVHLVVCRAVSSILTLPRLKSQVWLIWPQS